MLKDMWIVTVKKDYTEITFEFECSDEATSFLYTVKTKAKNEIEATLTFEKKGK